MLTHCGIKQNHIDNLLAPWKPVMGARKARCGTYIEDSSRACCTHPQLSPLVHGQSDSVSHRACMEIRNRVNEECIFKTWVLEEMRYGGRQQIGACSPSCNRRPPAEQQPLKTCQTALDWPPIHTFSSPSEQLVPSGPVGLQQRAQETMHTAWP